MSDYEQFRVFVGGLSWEISDRELENEFKRFGKVIDAKIMLDRDTGRPRGFGFVTFADKRGMEEAISRLHDREFDGRVVSVTKAQPKVNNGGGDKSASYKGGYENGGGTRGGGYSGRGAGGAGRDDCFKCGQPGHWARECPTGEGRVSSRTDRYSGGGGRDRYGGGGGGRDRYAPASGYGSGRYSDRERDRDGDRAYDRYESSTYGRYGDRDANRGSDRYGSGGAARFEGKYRERSGPYDRPSGAGRSSAYDDRY